MKRRLSGVYLSIATENNSNTTWAEGGGRASIPVTVDTFAAKSTKLEVGNSLITSENLRQTAFENASFPFS